jgi:membrane protein
MAAENSTPSTEIDELPAPGECDRPALSFGAWVLSETRWLVRVLISSADRFYWDNGFSKAASLAYTSLASLVPIVALGSGILASFAVSSQYLPAVREFLFKQFVPDNQVVDTVLAYLEDFSAAISSLNVLVIGFLVVTSLLLINSVEYTLNETWQVFEPRAIAQRIAIFSAILLLAPVLLLSAYYFTNFQVQPLLAEVHSLAFLDSIYRVLLPFFIDYAAFVCLYYLVPKAPVKFRSAVFGAFVGGILFNLAKYGFAVYLAHFANYDRIYKAVSVIPISLFWLYLAWTIVLFGAEASYQAQYLPRRGKLWKRSVMSVGDARLLLGVQSLVLVAKAFQAGSRMLNDNEIAEYLGCSSVVLKPALDALENAGIISRGDSREMPVTLLRTPEKISVAEVRQALFGARSSTLFAKEMERLFAGLGERDMRCTVGDLLRV